MTCRQNWYWTIALLLCALTTFGTSVNAASRVNAIHSPKKPSNPIASDPAGESVEDDSIIVYTQEELEAIRQVRDKLVQEHGVDESRLSLIFLAVATINTKLRVDATCKKVQKVLDIMKDLGCPNGMSDEALWRPEAVSELATYAPCGQNHQGAATTWIRTGNQVPKEEERKHVHACIMHFLASHADPISLRNGITFVIDVTIQPKGPKIGNENTLQSFWQSFPQRPQCIMIAGTNTLTRVLVNAAIRLASLFTKQKVLDRIKFVTVEEAKECIPLESAPVYCGGEGGGIEDMALWVQDRLAALPKPEL